MAQGGGSAVVITVAVMLCLAVVAEAAIFTAGDAGGWTFNVVNWPKGKKFRSGDILVFKYNPSFHNVVAVNKVGYDSCRVPKRSRRFTSGNDKIKVVKGMNYFICSFPGHCESNMKIAINAA